MREIEIKVRLRDKKGLLAALAAKGVVLSEIKCWLAGRSWR